MSYGSDTPGGSADFGGGNAGNAGNTGNDPGFDFDFDNDLNDDTMANNTGYASDFSGMSLNKFEKAAAYAGYNFNELLDKVKKSSTSSKVGQILGVITNPKIAIGTVLGKVLGKTAIDLAKDYNLSTTEAKKTANAIAQYDALPETEKTNAKTSLEKAFKSAQGDTGNRNTNSTVSSINSEGIMNTNETGTTNYTDVGERPIYANMVDRFFNGDITMDDLLKQGSDHAADAAGTYNNNIRGATDTQNTLLGTTMGDIGGATTKQNNLLDSLISNAMGNNQNIYKPYTFNINGQDMSFVPKANRNLGAHIADLGQTGYNNTVNSGKTISDMGQDRYDNVLGTEANVLATTPLTDPTVAQKQYYEMLQKLADMEYERQALDKGIALNTRKLDQNEPGTLQKVGEVISTIKGISDLGSAFGF